ncbi:MAG TPA: pirin family protein [Flavipsychrobacter sp.]|nr:pirin family protein [Flavipsychrobacter sp.]
MKTIFHKSAERGHMNFGWLDTYHSFSFGQYYDAKKMHFGALRVLNDDVVKGGNGFGTHPHDNMEIVTIPLVGALEHQDSSGGKGVIHVNDVQLMSAGSGIEHSEYNYHPTEDVNFLQIWIYPKERNIAPRYDQKTFLPEERINKLQYVVAPNDSSALNAHQDTWISLGNFDKGQQLTYSFHQQNMGLYLMVLEGSVLINDSLLNRRDAIAIADTHSIDINMEESKTQLILIEVPLFN